MIEWHCEARPAPGEAVSGDRACVVTGGGRATALAADGLGHGPQAAVASDRAAGVLTTEGPARPADLAARCHDALRGTRGAAVSVAAIDFRASMLTWVGVGNVEGRVVRAPGQADPPAGESLLNRAGVVGHDLPKLREQTVPLHRGDLVLMATDGVDGGFADGLDGSGSCRDIAARILERHGRPHDDALVLAVRYLGDGS